VSNPSDSSFKISLDKIFEPKIKKNGDRGSPC
jgi:hypothetical protein